jgi:hypothetical protein
MRQSTWNGGTVVDSSGNDIYEPDTSHNTNVLGAAFNLAEDGLVEMFYAFEQSGRTWKRYDLWEGGIVLAEPKLIDPAMGNPDLYPMFYDDDDNTVYPPGAYPHFEATQFFVNNILHRMGINIYKTSDPTVMSEIGKGVNKKEYISGVKEGFIPAGPQSTGYLQVPTMPTSFFQVLNVAMETLQDGESTPDVANGQNPAGDSAASGRKIELLQQGAMVKRNPLFVKRDEMLRDLARGKCLRLYKGILEAGEEEYEQIKASIDTQNEQIQVRNNISLLNGGIPQEEAKQYPPMSTVLPESFIDPETEQPYPLSTIANELNFTYEISSMKTRSQKYVEFYLAWDITMPQMQLLFPDNSYFAVLTSVELASLYVGTPEIAEEVLNAINNKYDLEQKTQEIIQVQAQETAKQMFEQAVEQKEQYEKDVDKAAKDIADEQRMLEKCAENKQQEGTQ